MKEKIVLTRSVDRAWDFYDSDLEALADLDLCQKLWDDIIAAGFTLVMPPQFHRFPGGGNGISFLAMLTESHVAIHTAPEKRGCLEITVHTCEIEGLPLKKTPAQKTAALIDIWKKRFNPQKVVDFHDRVRADANW
jgi:S-adenosylmethionine/arginine decarboxylase-like enzyme